MQDIDRDIEQAVGRTSEALRLLQSDVDGGDAEAHGSMSGGRVKQASVEIDAALQSLGGSDVEAHHSVYSDERLKEAVNQMQSALATLREFDAPAAGPDDPADVEAHLHSAWSDERLKQAIEQTTSALQTLRALSRESSTRA